MGRPKGNGSNTTPNRDYTDSNRASQNDGSRGRNNSGRTVESERPRESQSRDMAAQGEHSHTASGSKGQVQETVTQGQNSECGSMVATSSNPWGNFVPTLPAVQNTASLNVTLDTGRPGEAGTAGIDEIFAATETLIEILQHLCHGILPEQSQDVHPYNFHSQPPQYKLSIDLQNNPNDGTPFSSPAGSESSDTLPNHRPDTATILLILACYSRLLHIYEPLVTSLRQLLQQSTNHSRPLSGSVPNTSHTLHLYFPAFNLGCFSLAASPGLNIRLMLHVVSHMLERTHRAVQLCVPAETNNNGRPLYASSVGEGPSRYWEARFGSESGGGLRGQHSSSSPMALAAEIALGEVCERGGS
ncbi:hypothetical protein FGG08_007458 [Glutinoglossum americanum]|uniref:Uncharacterized protein n=1 Tax=Glutinoglossum americanum TaxID=1670608 RepID=A0A9P8HTV9_9PEZI|nr:hypothetical protein FGG08_007458 [Glutinoglossum americanum]